jgi:hypothetical protein
MAKELEMSTEETKTSKQCQANKQNGGKCEVTALSDSDFCFFHDPSTAAERKAAQSLGGKGNRMKTLDPGIPDVKIENASDMLALLYETINQVRKGLIDPRVANAVGYLANIAMRAVDLNDLNARIRRLESVLENPMALVGRR